MSRTYIALFSGVWLSGCGMVEFSPWASNPQSKNLTAKHLAMLEYTNSSTFEPFKFALTGDSQAVVGHMSDVVDVINYMADVEFITLAGDITDRGLLKEYELIDRVIDESEKPLLTVVGNHDGLNNSKKIYKEMFGPLDYSFIYKDVKIVMWNNNPYEWDISFQFLRDELSSGHRTIVIAHHPPSNGSMSQAQEDEWKSIREEYSNLEASLHGHMHKYAFRLENGLPIYTVARVTSSMFAVVSVRSDGVFIQDCTPLCGVPRGGEQ